DRAFQRTVWIAPGLYSITEEKVSESCTKFFLAATVKPMRFFAGHIWNGAWQMGDLFGSRVSADCQSAIQQSPTLRYARTAISNAYFSPWIGALHAFLLGSY